MRAWGVVSLCSLMSAAAGVCANTARQPLPRAGCEQSHTVSPGGTCTPAAASPTGTPAKAGRGRRLGWSCVTGWERELVQDLPPAASATTPPDVLEDMAALLPGAPQRQLWQPAWEPAWSLEEPQTGPALSLAQHLLLTSLGGKGVPTAHPRQDPHCGLRARSPHGHLSPWTPARSPGGSRGCRGYHPPHP